MSIPFWVIGRKFLPGGSCLVKRPLWQPPAQEPCPGCGVELKGVDWTKKHYAHTIHNEVCNKCWDTKYCALAEAQRSALSHWRPPERFGSHAVAIKDEFGNLKLDEYRFWVGCAFRDAIWSKCRCCGQEVYNPENRAAHKRSHGTPGSKYIENCAQTLVKAYAILLSAGKCVICEGSTYGLKTYGVPICSKTCLQRWRFDRMSQAPLLKALETVMQEGKSGG